MPTLSRRALLAAAPGLIATPALLAAPAIVRAQSLGSKGVKIGLITDFNSMYQNYTGKTSLTCLEFGIADFKAQYKPDFEIEMVSADHQNKPDIASAIAQRWYDNEGVDAIFDVPAGAAILAVMLVAKSRNKPVFSIAGINSRITNEDCNAVTTQWATSSQATAAVNVKALLDQGVKTFFFVATDSTTGATATTDATRVIEAAGAKVLGVVKHPVNAADFSSFILQAQASGAEAVVLANSGPEVVGSVKAAREFNLTPRQKLVSMTMGIPDVHGIGLELGQGLLFSEGWAWNLNEDTKSFGRRVYAVTQRMPSSYQAPNYSAVMHYLKAVQATKGLDTAAIMAWMQANPVNDLVFRNVRVRKDGRVMHDMYMFRIKAPAEQKEPWDYMDLVRTIPGAVAFPDAESTCALTKQA